MKKLLEYDTPSITNVVATYPAKELCLGLYHPWEGHWYTDETLKCMFPELGPRVGYAVTVVYGPVDPAYNKLGITDVLRAIEKSPKPVILAVKQQFPEHIKKINGLLGGNMMTAFKAAGAVGVLSDEPSRDLEEIRPMEMQYMLTGLTPGHGDFAVYAVNVPVEICGMGVAPGEIIHMDANGAVKFPAEYLDEVAKRVGPFCEEEEKKQAMMRQTNNAEQLGRYMRGIYD